MLSPLKKFLKPVARNAIAEFHVGTRLASVYLDLSGNDLEEGNDVNFPLTFKMFGKVWFQLFQKWFPQGLLFGSDGYYVKIIPFGRFKKPVVGAYKLFLEIGKS